MRYLRHSVLLALIAFVVFLPGCVRLDGQRISWSYDAAKDELQILIHYDGVHDSGDDKHGEGVEQIAKFVQNSEVMVLDWPFLLSRERWQETAENPAADPKERASARSLADLWVTMKIETIGYYREPDGKLGAVQHITIPHAKAFIEKINTLISTSIIEEFAKDRKDLPGEPVPKILERIEAAAKANHPWIRLDGHAIRIVVPVHPGEWNREKGKFIEKTTKDLADCIREKPEETTQYLRGILKMLAFTPVSYIDRGDQVEVILGRSLTPNTIRMEIRDQYQPNLDEVIVKTVKTNLDAQLAEALLDDRTKPSALLAAVLKFGPPEDQIRALMTAFDKADEKGKQKIVGRLNRWAVEWNAESIVPLAPTELKATDDLKDWKAWYTAVQANRWLLGGTGPDKTKPEKTD